MKHTPNMKHTPKLLLASLAALSLLSLPALCHADGLLQNGDTQHPITLFAASTSDGQTGVTGATLTLTISKNGGAFASPTGTVAEIGGGYYKYTPSVADDGTDGELVVNAAAAGAYINPERRRIIAINADDLNLALPQLAKIGTNAADSPNQVVTQQSALTNLDAKVSTRLPTSGYVPPTPFPATVTLASADEAALGKLTFDASSYLLVNAKALPAVAPTGYGGGAVSGLQPADLASIVQAIMTYSLHSGVSYQRAVAQIYLNTAGAGTATKSGTVQTNPFQWPDGSVGYTSILNSATGQRTVTPGVLPN